MECLFMVCDGTAGMLATDTTLMEDCQAHNLLVSDSIAWAVHRPIETSSQHVLAFQQNRFCYFVDHSSASSYLNSYFTSHKKVVGTNFEQVNAFEQVCFQD